MSTVKAKCDIVSTKGFCVARTGDVGKPVLGVRPCRPEHWNKVPVIWRGCKRGYWCDPADLQSRRDLRDFLAAPPDRARKALPVSAVSYEFHFGKNLRRLRESRKLTQAELACAMTEAGFGAAQSTVCYRERRPDAPGSLFVDAAAKVLAVPPFIFYLDWGSCEAFTSAKAFLCCMSSAVCFDPEA